MSDCLLVHTLQVCTQGLLALQEDSTDVTGYCWSLVQSLEVLFQAVVVLEYLPTVGALILLASFCQQDRTFRVAALEVVYQVFRVMGDSLPVHVETIWFSASDPTLCHLGVVGGMVFENV